MQFTEKEIELAKQLKEAGIEWKPSFGDVVLIKDELLTREYQNVLKWKGLVDGVELHDDCFTGIVIGTPNLPAHGDLEVAVWDNYRWIASAEQTILLPCWHQGRRILTKRGWFLEEHYDVPDEHHVSLWLSKEWEKNDSRDGCDIIEVEGETDLEAMYQVILNALCKNVADMGQFPDPKITVSAATVKEQGLKPFVCPVCGGHGRKPYGFYNSIVEDWC